MSIKLTKKILMAAPGGAYLVSNCYQGSTPLLSIFEEIVSPPQERKQQWERVLTAHASQRLCRVFASKEDYQAWLREVLPPQVSVLPDSIQ